MKTFILFLCIFVSLSTFAQFGNIGNKIKSKTEKKVDKQVDKGIDKGLNKTEEKVEKSFDKKNKPDSTKSEKKSTDNSQVNNTNTSKTDEKPSLQSYSKYDFVPGDQVLLYEDFSQDAIGDFPMLWTTDVAGEINSLNIAPGKWFNLNSSEGTYWFMKDIDFPKNFILEMDIVPKATGGRIAADLVFFGEDNHSEMDKNGNPGTCGLHIEMEKANWETKGYIKGNNEFLEGSSTVNPVEQEKVNHVIIWVQNRRVRIYHKGAKVIDIPTNIYEGSKFKRLCFKLHRGASCGSYISNVKITTAAPDTRSKLLTEGKLISYGIYFDVNKDEVKPESYGTLKGIADVLKENPTVKIKIVGYTDSDGDDKANLDLSKRRAANVKNSLVKDFGIDASLIETDGLGESQPIAPNDKPENKAKNRRVEFIKL
jgi:outer membrane protein OmpA-like peptidoglycan-associated protein